MVQLKIPPEDAVRILGERIDAVGSIGATSEGPDYYDFVRWCTGTYQAVDSIYPPGEPYSDDIRSIGLQNCSCNANIKAAILIDAHVARLEDYIRQIRDSNA